MVPRLRTLTTIWLTAFALGLAAQTPDTAIIRGLVVDQSNTAVAGVQVTATSGNQLTSDTLGQTSLSVSGPIGRGDRTQFFAAGEYSRQDRASPITSPIAPGSYVGRYRGWLGFFRLDRQINETNNMFFRSNVDGFHDTNPNGTVGGNSLPTVARVFRRRTYSEGLGETAALSPTVLNAAKSSAVLSTSASSSTTHAHKACRYAKAPPTSATSPT
jgi:hypothetical protein